MSHGLQKAVDEVPVFEIPPDHSPAAVRVDGCPKQARIKFGNVHVKKPNISVKPLVSSYPGETEKDGREGRATGLASLQSTREENGNMRDMDSQHSVRSGWGDDDVPRPEVRGWADTGDVCGPNEKDNTAESAGGGGLWNKTAWGEIIGTSAKVSDVEGKGRWRDEVDFGLPGLEEKIHGRSHDLGNESQCHIVEPPAEYENELSGKAGMSGKGNAHRGKTESRERVDPKDSFDADEESKEITQEKVKSKHKGKDSEKDVGDDERTRNTKGGKKRKSRMDEQEQENCEVEEDRKVCLFPREARLRNLTYAADIFIDMVVEIYVPNHTLGPDAEGMNHGEPGAGPSITEGSGEKILDVISLPQTLLGKIPVMVHSKFCNLYGLNGTTRHKEDCAFDVGGYFIVKGAEKVLFAQEQQFTRRITVFRNNLGLTASAGGEYKGSNLTYRNSVFLRELVPKKGSEPASGPWVCTTRLRRVNGFIPIIIVLRALGLSSDKEVLEIICGNLHDKGMVELALPFIWHADKEMTEFLKAAKKDVTKSHTRKSALKYIGAKLQSRMHFTSATAGKLSATAAAREVLDQLCPNQPELNDRGKQLLLGYMAFKVCRCHLELCELDDRDDFRNKRLDLAGNLLNLEFRNLFHRFKNEMKKRIQKALLKTNVKFKIDSTIVTTGFQRAFSTGEWSCVGDMKAKVTGVVAELPRANPMSAHCQLRKMKTRVNYIAKATNARFLNYSHWGRACILETPDGENCGLVKNLALASFVSVEDGCSEDIVYECLDTLKLEPLNTATAECLRASHRVFLNAKLVGCHRDPRGLVDGLRKLRRDEEGLNNQVEIVLDDKMNEIRIYTDAGRTLRPLLVVESQALKITSAHIAALNSGRPDGLTYLLNQGVMELMGVEEEEQAVIALDTAELEVARGNPHANFFTHCELHPALLFGLGACMIPFANHNQSLRNMHQAQKHGKQAIGNYTTNLFARSDTSGHQLFYPQTQIVKTGAATCLEKDELVNGQNAIVAIACYSGYNQEDSLIMNKSSVDRGLFRTFHYRTHRSTLRVVGEEFGRPSPPEGTVSTRSKKAYAKLDSDGFPSVGQQLLEGEIIAGKVRDDRANIGFSADVSDKVKLSNQGWVDQVIQTTEEDGTRIAKVRMRSSRPPQVGDKFSSMHGQKGVVGMLFEQEDMPFTTEGIVPDVIINPHAFPTRQTLGQLMECLHGKAIAAHVQDSKEPGKLRRSDATPFTALTVHEIAAELHHAGYQKWGKECMFSGSTGEKMQALITVGPTFYQRLSHMVVDKLKYRGRGFVHPLTRQPVKERDRHGGVKFGEMERDCMIAHGAAMTLRERTFVLSDFYRVYYCKQCQLLASMDHNTRIPSCRRCRSSKRIVQLEIPYACKLLHQELLSMGICVRLLTEPC